MNKYLCVLGIIALILLNWIAWLMIGFMCVFTKHFSWMYRAAPFISLVSMICIILFGYRFYKTIED